MVLVYEIGRNSPNCSIAIVLRGSYGINAGLSRVLKDDSFWVRFQSQTQHFQLVGNSGVETVPIGLYLNLLQPFKNTIHDLLFISTMIRLFCSFFRGNGRLRRLLRGATCQTSLLAIWFLRSW